MADNKERTSLLDRIKKFKKQTAEKNRTVRKAK